MVLFQYCFRQKIVLGQRDDEMNLRSPFEGFMRDCIEDDVRAQSGTVPVPG
jgi:hypothetical protein